MAMKSSSVCALEPEKLTIIHHLILGPAVLTLSTDELEPLDVECNRDLVLVDHGGGVGHVLVLVLGDHGDDLVLRPPGGGAPVDVS